MYKLKITRKTKQNKVFRISNKAQNQNKINF